MPLAACSKEPHKETLGNGQNYSDLFSFSRLEAKLQKSLKRWDRTTQWCQNSLFALLPHDGSIRTLILPGFTALKGRMSKILEIKGQEFRQTMRDPVLVNQGPGSSCGSQCLLRVLRSVLHKQNPQAFAGNGSTKEYAASSNRTHHFPKICHNLGTSNEDHFKDTLLTVLVGEFVKLYTGIFTTWQHQQGAASKAHFPTTGPGLDLTAARRPGTKRLALYLRFGAAKGEKRGMIRNDSNGFEWVKTLFCWSSDEQPEKKTRMVYVGMLTHF